jgi:hypothetical protein
LCTTCVVTLQRDLEAVPDLLQDLDITISKQDRLFDHSGRKTDDHPLPLKLGPMEAKRDLYQTLRTWARHITNQRGEPAWWRSDDTTAYHYAEFLLDCLRQIQRDEGAGDLADEIGYAVIQAQRAVDKPMQLQYVGPCDECGADLYAHPRADTVACRNCECEPYNVQQRRKWLLDQVEGQMLTATEMSRALPGLLQKPLTAGTVRGWARHGKLTAYPPLPHRPRDPVYSVGDVLTILFEMPTEEG